ncbi:MAG: N-acetylmuramoyl-L-alanine amidase [Opitutaceae bacterium]
MVLPALRLAALAAFAMLALCGELGAAGSTPRVAPSRPAQLKPTVRLAAIKVEGMDYFEVEDAVALLGLKPAGRDGRKFVFEDANSRLVIGEGRELLVDGLRVFLGNAVVTRRGKLYLSEVDFEACLAPIMAPWLIEPKPRVPRIIVIDAGHGDPDDGMINLRLKMKEKTFTLDVALRVKKLLETMDCKVVLTRKDDRGLSPIKLTDLRLRSQAANRAGADLFVSIHFNADRDAKTSGSEVYTFTRPFQRSDASAGFGQGDDSDPEAAPINRFDPWNSLLAHTIQKEVRGELKTSDRGIKTMHAGVLRGLNCPGVLVESVFLTNDTEARLVATPAYRQQIAQAIANGIRNYTTKIESLRAKPAGGTSRAATPSKLR